MSAPFVTSAALADAGIVHGFFGRQGGVSTGEFESLNLSTAVGDEAANVAANRRRALAALALADRPLARVRQVHSATAIALESLCEGVEADGMATRTDGLVLGILTADCAPVLLADARAGVVAALHAGWRGAAAGIVADTVRRMRELGALPHRIVAAIGPTISAPNYEVGEEFAADLLERHPDAAHRFHTPGGGRPHFDLPGFVRDRLAEAGIAAIDELDLCTYAHPQRYFSHRRATHEGTVTGRQIALIALS